MDRGFVGVKTMYLLGKRVNPLAFGVKLEKPGPTFGVKIVDFLWVRRLGPLRVVSLFSTHSVYQPRKGLTEAETWKSFAANYLLGCSFFY